MIRQSNFELLRIISMLMVLALHANFMAIGVPNHDALISDPANVFLRFSNEAFSIVAVNVFILIAGWFGINSSFKKISSLIFQCLFFSIGLLLFCTIIGKPYTITNVIRSLFLIDYWFIISYIGLFLISPLLNAFIKIADKTLFKKIIFSLLLLQAIYGWTFQGLAGFHNGSSIISFIILYLIARYIRLFSPPPYFSRHSLVTT